MRGYRVTKYGVVHPHGSPSVHHNGVLGCDSRANGLGCTPVAVIDPEGDADIDRMAALLGEGVSPARVRSMLRELVNPKPYREHTGTSAPWPVVPECHSQDDLESHECPQCEWKHKHDWVAWRRTEFDRHVSIRCSKCGGRKCDVDLCDKQRHTHSHQEIGGLAS